jgi:hypothetical protein
MAPVSKFAMQVILNDGTVLWVNRDGVTPTIEGMEPSESLALLLQSHIDELAMLSTELLSQETIIEKYVLPQLRLCSSPSRHRPRFLSGELVAIVLNQEAASNTVELLEASIRDVKRP